MTGVGGIATRGATAGGGRSATSGGSGGVNEAEMEMHFLFFLFYFTSKHPSAKSASNIYT